jgi:hypothetical protein
MKQNYKSRVSRIGKYQIFIISLKTNFNVMDAKDSIVKSVVRVFHLYIGQL